MKTIGIIIALSLLGCGGEPPIDGRARLGAECSQPSECASGMCGADGFVEDGGHCTAACATDADCGAGCCVATNAGRRFCFFSAQRFSCPAK